jgi:hypothetical protein
VDFGFGIEEGEGPKSRVGMFFFLTPGFRLVPIENQKSKL